MKATDFTHSQRDLLKRFYISNSMHVNELHCQSKTIDPLVKQGLIDRATQTKSIFYWITPKGKVYAEKLFNCLE